MKEIIVKTQGQLDKIKIDFEGKIVIKDTKKALSINKFYQNAEIYVYDNAVIECVYDNAVIEYVSDNAVIECVYDNATIESVSGNATIECVYGNAVIKYVSDNAVIKYVSGNATIECVYGNAVIKSVSGNATIKSVSGNAVIKYVYDNAVIEYVYDNATILLITGLACICFLYSANKIVAKGMNMIRQIGYKKINIDISSSVNFIQIKETIKETPTWDIYSKLYPVKQSKKMAIMYKAVRKIDGKYFSNYDNNFEYKIGEIKKEECDKNTEESCSSGLHISHKNWALLFGKGWDDLAILEVEVNIDDVVVCSDCDGKVRTSKLKVLRELPKEEYYD